MPSIGARHRNRKKCRPHSEQRYGESSHDKALSMALRTPTPLNSTDLQFGHRAEAIILPDSFLQSEAVFADEPVPVTALFRKEAAEPCALDPCPGPWVARLASRAALICSGVLRSGSESWTCSFARETLRLCRFNNRLSIDTLF